MIKIDAPTIRISVNFQSYSTLKHKTLEFFLILVDDLFDGGPSQSRRSLKGPGSHDRALSFFKLYMPSLIATVTCHILDENTYLTVTYQDHLTLWLRRKLPVFWENTYLVQPYGQIEFNLEMLQCQYT